MPFRDNLVLFRSRLAANLPQASLSNQSVFMGFAQAFLSADADTQALIGASQPDMFLSSATGTALDRKAADYGARRQAGLPARVKLTFFLDQPAASGITIPQLTLVSTIGDGLVTDSIFFRTEQDAYINAGETTAYMIVGTPPYPQWVWATATVMGSVGNVASNTIIVSNGGLLGGLLNVTNEERAYGGIDQQTDNSLRALALTNILSKYAPHSLEKAMLAVNGVFDALVIDPQDGTGVVHAYWCDVDGNTPGLTGEGELSLIQGNSLADAVNVALVRVLPPTVRAFYFPFDVLPVVPAAVYLAPPGYETSALTPLIQQAIADYINGLTHGQTVTLYGMVQFVTGAVGQILVDFVPTVSPSIATSESAPTILYRYPGDAATITVIREF